MKLISLEGAPAGRLPTFYYPKWFNFSFGRLFLISDDGEPKYEGYQIWVHQDIPDYNDPSKNVINTKYPIKNYSF